MTQFVREKKTGYKFLYNDMTKSLLERQERDWELFDDTPAVEPEPPSVTPDLPHRPLLTLKKGK
jgi:hypothetical protein